MCVTRFSALAHAGRLLCPLTPPTIQSGFGVSDTSPTRLEWGLAGEALFVLQLMTFKWDEEEPYPSYNTLAERMGVTPKMVRRYEQSLQRKGYLQRKYQAQAPNRFDLSGLFAALKWADYRKMKAAEEGGEEPVLL